MKTNEEAGTKPLRSLQQLGMAKRHLPTTSKAHRRTGEIPLDLALRVSPGQCEEVITSLSGENQSAALSSEEAGAEPKASPPTLSQVTVGKSLKHSSPS